VSLDDLPPELAASLSACLAAGRRFYLAWHPDYPVGVLRNKDAKGLAEWQERAWKIFDGKPPTIDDVSDAIPDLWRALLGDNSTDRRIVFQPPATLAVLHGSPVFGESVINVEAVFEDLAGKFSPEPPSMWEQMKREFEERTNLVRPWIAWEDRREAWGGLEPGVWCWMDGWTVAPADPKVGGDLTQPVTLEACAAHLRESGHGDGGWLEVQAGQRLRILRLPWPEGEVRPWAVSSPGQPA
jgi:hypothetical protein